jgi:hypothetical protein
MLISSVEIKEVILPQIKEFNTMENQEGIKKDRNSTFAGGCGVQKQFS